MFYVHEIKKLIGMICCHVDDFHHAEDQRFKKLIEKISERFSAAKKSKRKHSNTQDFKFSSFQVRLLWTILTVLTT